LFTQVVSLLFRPPQTKISEKVLIPQEEYPDINFVGLLIGPRGNTLKAMEKDVSCLMNYNFTLFYLVCINLITFKSYLYLLDWR